ncbi:hypothetical protein G8C92_24715 [Paenibacillus donghaensis]|uniref:hypothetical protein n=1 Tax=Paenibacillus donghaensis TaxID=414771 RepID=UPI001883F849|nr:hypothetical protein [Paenibacillus donghaensis]MBE9917223.1 hypothetical protein [Paenibacillus donghaensis]
MTLPVQDALIKVGGSRWEAALHRNGHVEHLRLLSDDGWVDVDFRKGAYAGFAWHGEWNGEKHVIGVTLDERDTDGAIFRGSSGALNFSLRYHSVDGQFAVTAAVANTGKIPVQPLSLGLMTGIDTYMEKFPDWNDKFFPTLLRCERTHFWGYCMRPEGALIGIASPQPIASWSLQYNVGYMEGELEWGGHRVETFTLDFLHAGPLPERHPQRLSELLPGETKEWTLLLLPFKRPDQLLPSLAPVCAAPMLELERTTLAKGECARMTIHSCESVAARVLLPDGRRMTVQPEAAGEGKYELLIQAGESQGHIRIEVENGSGKQSEALVSVRPHWLWFLDKARTAALICPPRATSHCESWYGLYTLYSSQQYFPDREMLEQTEQIMSSIYPLMFDMETHEPLLVKHRIQNVSSMVGVLVDRYEATGDEAALQRASDLADWLISHAQYPDGSYRAGKTHYTSVIYPAKSLMELILAEKALAECNAVWRERLVRHTASVRRAMDELVAADGDIDTEGELTYEDGMISCSSLQLGLFALMQPEDERGPYREAALKLLNGHECLANLLIPDGRQRGATRRFWESQYDVAIQPNMLNSPHAWTSWRTYGTWYAYLLTGQVYYLEQTMNALASCVQMVDMSSGALRWAFVPDPYVRARQISEQMAVSDWSRAQEGHHHTLKYPSQEFVIGEQYIGMISDWHEANLQDNDVHEHFKCLAEVSLGKAYVAQDETGRLRTWNCSAEVKNGILHVYPTEPKVELVHLNLGVKKVCVHFESGEISADLRETVWVRKDGRIIRDLFIGQ